MAIALQDQSLHELQQVTDGGDVGVHLGGSRVGQPRPPLGIPTPHSGEVQGQLPCMQQSGRGGPTLL